MTERINQRQRGLVDEAVIELRHLLTEAVTDPERAHGRADEILLDLLDAFHPFTADVSAAYRAVVAAAPWWAAA